MSDQLDSTIAAALSDEAGVGFQHPVDELVERLASEAEVHISGASGGYSSALFAQVCQASERLPVFVTANLKQARSLGRDLESFGLGSVGTQILILPSQDTSPYGDVSPDRYQVMERLNSQFRLAMGDDLRALIVPIGGAMRKLVPWKAVEDASMMLSVGDSLDLEKLRSVLALGGYQSVRLVEDPGTFAIRGGLVDIFSPYSEEPVRLDLWGDEIESIRCFDPQTQRTTEEQSDLFIFPAREEVRNPEALSRARRRIRELGDQLELPSSQSTALLAELDSGAYFFGIESLLPAFLELEPAFEILPHEAQWILIEPDALREAAELIWSKLEVDYDEHVAAGELAFEPGEYYLRPEAVLASLNDKPHRLVSSTFQERDGALGFRCRDNSDVERVRKQHDETEGTVHALLQLFQQLATQYGRVAFACHSTGVAERLTRLLKGYGQKTEIREGAIPVGVVPPPATCFEVYASPVSSGFRSPAMGLAIIPDSAIFGRSARRRASKVVEEAFAVSHFKELAAGDLVVHLEFGLARYQGMEKLVLDGVAADYLKLEFAGSDRLYLPVYRLGRVHKHVGESGRLTLDKLGGVRWEKTKSKVKEELKELAAELLALYAERAERRGYAFPEPDSYYDEFEASFPFDETPHQENAILEVLEDMKSNQPMDRLLCGDVGFGKTEVGIRAAFLSVLSGKQVAVLVPTTILAEQHWRSFKERLRNYPVRVEALSRFRSRKEQKKIVADLEKGSVDILIGTHRLLSKDIVFKDLGLIVVDEEQRFGVRHKERLKQFKKTVDVLSMTATPIPRTLEMSLLGIRDLSVILTPPTDRLAVQTLVAQFGKGVIREAIERELGRGGQVYFVTNRVAGIQELAETVREVVPNARVGVGHAQLTNQALEKVMHQFFNREIDVLVSTTIVESGLDVSSANTILIHRADNFGLSQLYQLRGRVGRGRERAFCYLLVPRRRKLQKDAARRLEVLRTHTDLGSGLFIAQHDLDIRGAGDLLGKDQSGHIQSVGYDLFCELLDETIREQRGEDVDQQVEPEVKIPVSAHLPDEYIPDESLRLLFYKRLSMATDDDQLDRIITELADRFGRFPQEVGHLREIISLKIALAQMNIEGVETGPSAVVITLGESCRLSPIKVVELVKRERGRFVLREDMKLIRYLRGKESEDLLAATRLAIERTRTCIA